MGSTITRMTWIVAFTVAFALVSTLVYRGSHAALSATTANAGNIWSAFGISLSDNDGGTALFSVSGLLPGDSGAKCLRVTYEGDDAPDGVRLYADVDGTDSSGVGTGQLPANLDLTISYDGDGPAATDCTGFVSDGTLATVALGSMPDDYTDGVELTSGGGDWQPADGESRTFRIQYALPIAAAATVQGDNATATFTWEAQKS